MRRAVWVALLAPAAFWMLQGTLGWLIAARACPRSGGTLSLGQARLLIGFITALTLAGTVTAVLFAWRALGRSDDDLHDEPRDRTRFLARMTLVIGLTMALGLCLAGLPSVILDACTESR
jgi:hypothetical protein